MITLDLDNWYYKMKQLSSRDVEYKEFGVDFYFFMTIIIDRMLDNYKYIEQK